MKAAAFFKMNQIAGVSVLKVSKSKMKYNRAANAMLHDSNSARVLNTQLFISSEGVQSMLHA
eukprot:scaffold672080_cov88-Prasinocladus_malaysianus.AAC.1